jgi:hypothetical protein
MKASARRPKAIFAERIAKVIRAIAAISIAGLTRQLFLSTL